MTDDKSTPDYEAAIKELQFASERLEKFRLNRPKPPYCSFCGNASNRVQLLIAGPEVFICDSCVVTCYEEVKKHTKPTKPGPPCPHCGKAIRTSRAQQCPHCLERWHD